MQVNIVYPTGIARVCVVGNGQGLVNRDKLLDNYIIVINN
jgi:hypothetical protein